MKTYSRRSALDGSRSGSDTAPSGVNQSKSNANTCPSDTTYTRRCLAEPATLCTSSYRSSVPKSRRVTFLRVFEQEGFACPVCGERMHLRALVLGPPATLRVLQGLKRSLRQGPGPALDAALRCVAAPQRRGTDRCIWGLWTTPEQLLQDSVLARRSSGWAPELAPPPPVRGASTTSMRRDRNRRRLSSAIRGSILDEVVLGDATVVTVDLAEPVTLAAERLQGFVYGVSPFNAYTYGLGFDCEGCAATLSEPSHCEDGAP